MVPALVFTVLLLQYVCLPLAFVYFQCTECMVGSHTLSICTTLGLNYLFKHFGLVVILCKYVSSDCVSQRSAETRGVTSTAPLPLHICDTARVTV